MEIKYDEPIEVSKDQFIKLMNRLKSVVAGREDNGKYYIRLWYPKHQKYFAKEIQSVLENKV